MDPTEPTIGEMWLNLTVFACGVAVILAVAI